MKTLLLVFCAAVLAFGAFAADVPANIPSGAYKLDKSHASLIFRVSDAVEIIIETEFTGPPPLGINQPGVKPVKPK